MDKISSEKTSQFITSQNDKRIDDTVIHRLNLTKADIAHKLVLVNNQQQGIQIQRATFLKQNNLAPLCERYIQVKKELRITASTLTSEECTRLADEWNTARSSFLDMQANYFFCVWLVKREDTQIQNLHRLTLFRTLLDTQYQLFQSIDAQKDSFVMDSCSKEIKADWQKTVQTWKQHTSNVEWVQLQEKIAYLRWQEGFLRDIDASNLTIEHLTSPEANPHHLVVGSSD